MTITAEIVLDSISPDGVRLTTMALCYPRLIHSEFMTHRAFSRNASSSRAIPVEKIIEEVERDPAMPVRFGLHGKGMQDAGEMSPFGQRRAYEDWLEVRDTVVAQVKKMLTRPERCSKQVINRLLEPFAHIRVCVTATEWTNFFMLRDHPDADPTIRALAAAMREAYDKSAPGLMDYGSWHLPYITDDDLKAMVIHLLEDGPMDEDKLIAAATEVACRVSTARCARVSYRTHDAKIPSVADDLALFDRLMGKNPLHASPAEHQATPDCKEEGAWACPHLHGNLVGWRQHRKFWYGENYAQHR